MKRQHAMKRSAAAHPFIESSYQVIDGKRINTQRMTCHAPGCSAEVHINHRAGGAPLPADVAANHIARKGWNIKKGYCPDHFGYKKPDLRVVPQVEPSEPDSIPTPSPEPMVQPDPQVPYSSLILEYLVEDHTSPTPKDFYTHSQLLADLEPQGVTSGAIGGFLFKLCADGFMEAHRVPGQREHRYKVIGDLLDCRIGKVRTAGSTPGRQLVKVNRTPVVLDEPPVPSAPEVPMPQNSSAKPSSTPVPKVDTAQTLADELLALSARLASLPLDLTTVPEQDLIEELRRRALARAS